MIIGFICKKTEKIWNREYSDLLPKDLHSKARRKLLMLDAATELRDLIIPPSNRLEKLKGDRKDSYSIRINNQWRICFVFKNGEASQVEIVDYH